MNLILFGPPGAGNLYNNNHNEPPHHKIYDDGIYSTFINSVKGGPGVNYGHGNKW